MEVVTKAIFLWKTRFKESSYFVTFLSEKGSLETFIIQGSKGAKKGMMAQLFPLNEVELEAFKTTKFKWAIIRNIKTVKLRLAIRSSVEKTAIAFFIAEVLSKSIKENDANQSFFQFVSSSIDMLEERYHPNFHLIFLLKLSRYLGFQPSATFSIFRTSFFDLNEGIFTVLRPMHTNYLETSESQLLYQLINDGFAFKITTNNIERKKILDGLLKYYELQIEGVTHLKTLPVLKELFN